MTERARPAPPDARLVQPRGRVGVRRHATPRLESQRHCTQVTYGGPDSAAASVSGSCTDRAGNRARPSAFGLKYDATAPVVTCRRRPPRGRERLVQPLAHGQLRGRRRDLWARRPADAADLRGTRHGDRVGERHLPRTTPATAPPGRRVQVRRDRTAATHVRLPRRRTRTAGTTPPLDGQLRGHRPARRVWSPARRWQTTRARTAAPPWSAATCRDKAGNGALASLPLKYDGTAPAARASPEARPTRTAGTTTRSRCGFAGSDATSGIDSCTGTERLRRPRRGGRLERHVQRSGGQLECRDAPSPSSTTRRLRTVGKRHARSGRRTGPVGTTGRSASR